MLERNKYITCYKKCRPSVGGGTGGAAVGADAQPADKWWAAEKFLLTYSVKV